MTITVAPPGGAAPRDLAFQGAVVLVVAGPAEVGTGIVVERDRRTVCRSILTPVWPSPSIALVGPVSNGMIARFIEGRAR